MDDDLRWPRRRGGAGCHRLTRPFALIPVLRLAACPPSSSVISRLVKLALFSPDGVSRDRPAGARRPPGGQRPGDSAAAAPTGVASTAAAPPDATSGAAAAAAAAPPHLGACVPAAALGPPPPAPDASTVIPPPAGSFRAAPLCCGPQGTARAVPGSVAPAAGTVGASPCAGAWAPFTSFGRTPVAATGAEAGGYGGRSASVIPGAPIPASQSSRPPPTASASSAVQPAVAAKPAAMAWPTPPRDAGGQGPGPLLAVPVSAGAATAGLMGQVPDPSAVHAGATVAVCLVCLTCPSALIPTKARAVLPILTCRPLPRRGAAGAVQPALQPVPTGEVAAALTRRKPLGDVTNCMPYPSETPRPALACSLAPSGRTAGGRVSASQCVHPVSPALPLESPTDDLLSTIGTPIRQVSLR